MNISEAQASELATLPPHEAAEAVQALTSETATAAEDLSRLVCFWALRNGQGLEWVVAFLLAVKAK